MQNFSELLWQEKAVCKGMTSKFFAPDIRVKIRSSFYREAVEICGECPVINDCREYALREEIMHGVWGGMTPNERRAEIYNRIHS